MTQLKNLLELLLFHTIKLFTRACPRLLCLAAGRIIGCIFYVFDKKHRSLALSNLKIAFGQEKPLPELKKISRKSFQHFGEFLIYFIKFSVTNDQKKEGLAVIEGKKYLEDALKKGKGVLLFSAHYGNWEIASFFLCKLGKLNVVARPLDNKNLEKKLLEIRRTLGAQVIYKLDATRQIIRKLRANEMVAIIIDQNVLRSQAVFVDFFGKKAATTPSLATFSLRTGAPIIPIFCYPLSPHPYYVRIGKPIDIPLKGDYKEDILKITQQCTNIIEEQIRQNPVYWLWFHNRWKTRPKNNKE